MFSQALDSVYMAANRGPYDVGGLRAVEVEMPERPAHLLDIICCTD